MLNKKKLISVLDIQKSNEYEHKPGKKNGIMKKLRRYEYQMTQYNDRYNHTDISIGDKSILKNKKEESEAKYEYYYTINNGSQWEC